MYQTPIRPDELYHFGIKGMHWGVRRYQNPDGSLTAAGRSHYGGGSRERTLIKSRDYNSGNHSKASNSSNVLDQTIKTGKGKENQSVAERVTSNTDRGVQSATRTLRDMSASKNSRDKQNERSALSKEASQMSDEELQRAIKRLDMERRYKDLSTETKRNGYDVAADVLSVVGGVTSVAASAAVVASTIYMMKKH